MPDLLIPFDAPEDLLPAWRGTPIQTLLEYQNLGRDHGHHTRAEILIGTCMDFRILLKIPRSFAFVIRAAGANLRRLDYQVSVAVAVGRVRHIALIGHDDCAMTGIAHRREEFIAELIAQGWSPEEATSHFDDNVSDHVIEDSPAFVVEDAQRLRQRYQGVVVAPLLYTVADGRLRQLRDPSTASP